LLDRSFDGDGETLPKVVPVDIPGHGFFRLGRTRIPPPFDAPENTGFLRFYPEFDL
jgi:hypothetical protein